ncbi:tetratricopeptide repeat protein 36 [Ambystoma mexicanum]|uniref:tetratricopeptide repeat protein 36 n=1 Tax=Ambystoma mexicanum TaxID=8296 RepID=UPI0037E8EE63
MATPGDLAVLQSILNPCTPFGDLPDLDVVEKGADALDDDDAYDPDLLKRVQDLELKGVLAAESGDIKVAIERFSEAIQLLPNRPSAHNNQAQALRLQGDVDGALKELNQAVNLSSGKGRSACQALVQRGLVYRLQGQDEAAREDFQCAAGLGSQFARHQLALMNPYAALCNRMLTEMVEKLRNPSVQQN